MGAPYSRDYPSPMPGSAQQGNLGFGTSSGVIGADNAFREGSGIRDDEIAARVRALRKHFNPMNNTRKDDDPDVKGKLATLVRAGLLTKSELKKFDDIPGASSEERRRVELSMVSSDGLAGSGKLAPAQSGGVSPDEKRPGNVRQDTGRVVEPKMPPPDQRYGRDNAYEDLPSSADEEKNQATFSTFFKFVEKQADQQLVTGIVLVPDETDAQKDIYGPFVVIKAAYEFLENFGKKTGLGFMHKDMDPPLSLCESWVARDDFVLAGQTIKKGTWLMTMRIRSKSLWEDVKSGKFTGFSVGGVAKVKKLEASQP